MGSDLTWQKLVGTLTPEGVAWDAKREKNRVFGLLMGKKLDIWLRPRQKPQGTQSMRYYYGVVIPAIAQACGYDDPDDWPAVHESLAWKFLRKPDHKLGYPQRHSLRKTDMSQESITAYISQVMDYAEHNIPDCQIPRPEDVDYSHLYAPNYDAEKG